MQLLHRSVYSAGLVHIGCYAVPGYSNTLTLLDGTDYELRDSPFTRDQPIRKCGSASLRAGYDAFAVTLGYCISGAGSTVSEIRAYKTYGSSSNCAEGVGNYASGSFYMDVYSIINTPNFQDSVEDIVNGTVPTIPSTDDAITDDLNASSGAIYLPSLALFFGLLIISLSLLF